MLYRLAKGADIEAICDMVKSAICNMNQHGIFQWDDFYPTEEDFLDDIRKQQLFAGLLDGDIAVIYSVNKECDEAYKNGRWRYPNCEYRVIHRLCVNPKYQNRGIARTTLFHIEEELKKLGIKVVRLDVFSKNPFAIALYLGNGYEKVGSADWRKGKFYLMEKLIHSGENEYLN